MSATRQGTDARIPVLLICCAGLVVGLSMGARHVQGLFMLPLLSEHGWGRSSFSFALGLQALVWGVAQPAAGYIADRYGTRRVILCGCVVYAIGLVMEAHAHSTAMLALGAGVVIGIGLTATTFAVVYGALSRLVATQAGSTAQGLAGAIGGLVQFVLVPLAQVGITSVGWSDTLQLLAAVTLVASASAWVLDDRAADDPQADAQPNAPRAAPVIAAALRHPGFWMLNIGFVSCGFQLAFLGTHLPAYLRDAGLSASAAVNAIAIIALANAAGTLVFGRLGDLYRRKYVLSALYTLRTLAVVVFVLAPVNTVTLYVFALAIGFTWLGTVPLTLGVLSQIFGVRYIGTLFGLVFLGHQLGGFLGAWLGGVVYDESHSYALMWTISIGLGVASIVLNLPIRDRSVEHALQPA